MAPTKIRVLSIFGTRPEVIKFSPILKRFENCADIDNVIVSTAQHREMIADLFELFNLSPDYDLNIIKPHQSLTGISVRALRRLEPILAACRPQMVLVQGDTTTAFIGSLAAFYHRSAIGHIEAGLRSFDKRHPYPEEVNRKLISTLSDIHFCPTTESAANLLNEGFPREQVFVTGNSVIDALLDVAHRNRGKLNGRVPEAALDGGRLILVTAHRRENLGDPLKNLCRALVRIVSDFEDARILYPVHLNPKVRDVVFDLIGDQPRIHLVDPLPYEPFVEAMQKSYLIITDSGGVQEEGPALGKPILVFRSVTERPEGLISGGVKLVGTGLDRLYSETARLLDDPVRYREMAVVASPYGDGLAARRIVDGVRFYFGRAARPEPFSGIDPSEQGRVDFTSGSSVSGGHNLKGDRRHELPGPS